MFSVFTQEGKLAALAAGEVLRGQEPNALQELRQFGRRRRGEVGCRKM